MKKNFWNIFKTFFKVGTLLLGGGFVVLPMLQCELAEKKHWATNEELCEFFALGQSLPGIVAPNMSMFVGYKLLGIKGAIAAVSGITLPAFIAIILIATILDEFAHLPILRSIFWGIGIGVIVMVLVAINEMWKKSIVDKFSALIFLVVFLLSFLTKLSPAYLILLAVIMGVSYKFLAERKNS